MRGFFEQSYKIELVHSSLVQTAEPDRVLRRYPRENAPRPVSAWEGEEHGLADLNPAEKAQVEEDDILMWRFIFLWMIATYLRQARQVQRPVGFLLEQPASPKHYMPQCVSFWDTTEWLKLMEEFGFSEATFCQGHHGGAATKPTIYGRKIGAEPRRTSNEEDILYCDQILI